MGVAAGGDLGDRGVGGGWVRVFDSREKLHRWMDA